MRVLVFRNVLTSLIFIYSASTFRSYAAFTVVGGLVGYLVNTMEINHSNTLKSRKEELLKSRAARGLVYPDPPIR